ncbi:Crp/Fnr family transcriptional regulator [Mucilaginibacter terrae]|uniref:CRP-like cAMP-binding protein n=1 Tax=Mucilaginibacter terrae TaxID=1955052 RepID=A0ABU3GVG7_9SPHI|nr:Crp/Fnr family transcriptional regulator [Mucilaginibacter terrae]MDT3403771.1 CRP-like cAMP-binding protein [Mucilaginibacter terrae]
MQDISSHICQAFGISIQDANVFLAAFKMTELKKNEVFISEGKICNKIGLIKKGLMKCVFKKDGKDVIFEFAYENSFVSDYYSFVTHTPSVKDIICLENTVVYIIDRQQLETLGRTHSFIEGMSRKTNEYLFLKMHDRLRSMMMDTAAERYIRLIKERPDLANRIPQYLLASYLNVQPETVSRIRSKIA